MKILILIGEVLQNIFDQNYKPGPGDVPSKLWYYLNEKDALFIFFIITGDLPVNVKNYTLLFLALAIFCNFAYIWNPAEVVMASNMT
jgi:hypothetical protein